MGNWVKKGGRLSHEEVREKQGVMKNVVGSLELESPIAP